MERGQCKQGAREVQARGEGCAKKVQVRGEGGASKERGWCKKGMNGFQARGKGNATKERGEFKQGARELQARGGQARGWGSTKKV